MNLDDYKTREQIEAAIRRRQEELEVARYQRDEHFEGWNYTAGRRHANIHKNIERLKAKLENCAQGK